LVLVAAVLAAALPATAAFADDADHVPGGGRSGAGLGRSMGENPGMKPYMTAPAPAAQAAAPVASVPQAQRVAAPQPARGLDDVMGMLDRADAAMRRHQVRQASTELEVAETRLLNARDAGTNLPDRAFADLSAAREALGHGRIDAARQATGELRQMLHNG